MKKISAYIIALLSLGLVSCQKEIQGPQQNEQDGKVTFRLDFTAPEADMQTKALGETVNLATNGLWVAVYDNGYRTEVVQATDLTLTDASTNKYTCNLTLTVTDKPRNLHFISMAGFTASSAPYEETRFGSLTTDSPLDAYWQIRTVSKIPYTLVTADWNAFLTELKGSTGTITLVRNFAKVTMSVKSGVNFQLESFKVFKTPSKGYVAPYISSGSSNGFISGYDLKEYNAALTAYPGRMPNDCTLSEYDATADADGASFYDYTADHDVAQYFYERPVPTEDPAFIIVKGKYDSDNDSSYDDESYSYYKINLRDALDNYYALLRGFRFKVCIDQVTATGYSTVIEAYNSAGSGDISTSLEYSSINNISDGVCRLFVNATSFTQIKAGTIELKYKFIPDYANNPTTVKNTEVDVDVVSNTGVEITVNSPATGIQPSIAKNSSDQWDYTVGTSDDSDGWRTITVKTTNPESLYKEQVITIRGRGKNSSTDDTSVIQRDVHIIIRPTLTLYAEMAKPDGKSYTDNVPFGSGKDVWVNVWMEDELPQSIFPLNVKIEAGSLTLTPAPGEQLPVESGQSASSSDPKPAFYFVKAISWADYTAATTATKTVGGVDRKMHKFTCKFKTNTNVSASSIYVSHELFNTASTSFTNATALTLTPVTPSNWSSTASEEPYAGQTFNATVVASVPAGTTITGTTTVGGSSTNVTASISGTLLTITLTGMSYSTSGFKDLAFATTLSTGSFSFTPKVVVWTAPSITKGVSEITSFSSLSSDQYIMISDYHSSNHYYLWNDPSDEKNDQVKMTNTGTFTSAYVWQVKNVNTTAKTCQLLNYGTGRYIANYASAEHTSGDGNHTSVMTTETSSEIATLTFNYSSSNWSIQASSSLRFNNSHNASKVVDYYTTATNEFRLWPCTVTPAVRPTE